MPASIGGGLTLIYSRTLSTRLYVGGVRAVRSAFTGRAEATRQ
jgi:hypothetical protein